MYWFRPPSYILPSAFTCFYAWISFSPAPFPLTMILIHLIIVTHFLCLFCHSVAGLRYAFIFLQGADQKRPNSESHLARHHETPHTHQNTGPFFLSGRSRHWLLSLCQLKLTYWPTHRTVSAELGHDALFSLCSVAHRRGTVKV